LQSTRIKTTVRHKQEQNKSKRKIEEVNANYFKSVFLRTPADSSRNTSSWNTLAAGVTAHSYVMSWNINSGCFVEREATLNKTFNK
jgi:hypothetical protein